MWITNVIIWFNFWSLLLLFYSLEQWTFQIMVLLSGALPNPKLQTSVLSIWLVTFFLVKVLELFHFMIRILYGMSLHRSFIFWMHHFHEFLSITNWTFLIPSFNTTGLFWMIPFGVSVAARLVFDAICSTYSLLLKKEKYVCNS